MMTKPPVDPERCAPRVIFENEIPSVPSNLHGPIFPRQPHANTSRRSCTRRKRSLACSPAGLRQLHRFVLETLIETVAPEFAAVTRLSEPAERRQYVEARTVDVHLAGPQF